MSLRCVVVILPLPSFSSTPRLSFHNHVVTASDGLVCHSRYGHLVQMLESTDSKPVRSNLPNLSIVPPIRRRNARSMASGSLVVPM